MEIQKELLTGGNSPTPALCHHQQQGIRLPGHPSLCSLSIGREIAPEEGCSLAAASLPLARLPWLHSRDLDELGSPAWGQQCFDRLRAFSSAGSLSVPLCDWKHFPAHRLLGKKKYPKTRGFVRRGRDGGVDQSMSGQRERRALPVLVTLPLKQMLLSSEQLCYPFIGLQYYHTLRHKLSPIFHLCTGEEARQEEDLHILV